MSIEKKREGMSTVLSRRVIITILFETCSTERFRRIDTESVKRNICIELNRECRDPGLEGGK